MVELHFSSDEPGEYAASGSSEYQVSAAVIWVYASYRAAVRETLGDCSPVTDWDSWLLLKEDADNAGYDTMVDGHMIDGTVTMTLEGSMRRVLIAEGTILFYDGSEGMLILDATAVDCTE